MSHGHQQELFGRGRFRLFSNVNGISMLQFAGFNLRLVAQIVTAALRTICLQLRPLAPPVPVNAASRLGKAGLAAPANDAAARALRVGRYKLRAVTERYVREPDRS